MRIPMIKYNQKKSFFILLTAVFLFFFTGSLTHILGLEPPTRAEIEKYKLEGTWMERLNKAQELGNHKTGENLVSRFRYNMQRQMLEMQGASPEEMGTMLPPPDWRGMPTKGMVKVLALLIAFSDYPPNAADTNPAMRAKIFGDGSGGYPYESMRNFYRRSSYNQLEIVGNVLGWYTTPYPRSSIAQTSQGRENLIKEALNFYNAAGHDFSQYDNDGDGTIDYFIVIWTGPDNGWANFWWGYQTGWDSTYKLDGKKLGTYSWQWEAKPVGGTFSPDVVIHETGHALGLPDYYDYDDSVGPDSGVGGLDQMDANWGDHNCFSKYLLEWITPTMYGSGSHTLTLEDSGTQKSATLFVPDPKAAPNAFYEFFMVQNRYRTGNDTDYPADGLLIWHVDARLNSSGTDFLYNNSYTSHKLLRLQEADGLEEIETGDGNADAGDYYTAGRNFTPLSKPNSNLYNGTATKASLGSISANGKTMICNLFFGNLTLTVSAGAGGTTSPAPGSYSYTSGSTVSLTALPSTNFRFFNWSGDASETTNPLSVLMDRDKTIKANFIQQYVLTIIAGAGGTTNPVPGPHKYDTGSNVQVTAEPNTYHYFKNWGEADTGTANPTTILMNGDKTLLAFFKLISPPNNFSGQKVLNRSLSQAEYINILLWEANPNNENIVSYKIYLVEGSVKTEVASLDQNTFTWRQRNVDKSKEYTYQIVAVNSGARPGMPATVVIQ